ncbi:MAG: DUF1566 domain-containing protein [Syntrophobacterales bacterium]|jgi:hypothetical protein
MRKFYFCLISVFLLFSLYFPNTVAAFVFGEETETQTQTESPNIKPYAKLSLRKEPKKNLGEKAVRVMLKRHNFYDRWLNPNGSFDNDFVDNGDGTVTDRATGLMWQKDGSPKPLTLKRATYYINSLNDKRFLGYSDWRMPTVEELASLIRKNVKRGLHINPLFTTKQKPCWSSDSGFVEDREIKDVWIVSFIEGKVVLQVLSDHTHMIFDYPETYYVRGVRSAR